jgi:hypothetical protein
LVAECRPSSFTTLFGAERFSIILSKHMRPPIAMYAVHPSTRHQSARARIFIDFPADKFRGDPPWDRGLFGDMTADELST